MMGKKERLELKIHECEDLRRKNNELVMALAEQRFILHQREGIIDTMAPRLKKTEGLLREYLQICDVNPTLNDVTQKLLAERTD